MPDLVTMLTMPPRARPYSAPKAVVDHAEFLHRFLRRRGALRAGGGVDVVRAVHRDHVAEVAHAAKGDAGGFKFRDGGLQAGAAGGHAGGQKREIGE